LSSGILDKPSSKIVPNTQPDSQPAQRRSTEDSGLSDEEIEAIRVQTDAWAHVILDIYLDQQRQERAREVATNERGSIPVWSENGSRLKSNS
jgi:hypothetical protein